MKATFEPVFNKYTMKDLISFDYNFFENAILTYKSETLLSTMVERIKQLYPTMTNLVIIYNRAILHSDLSTDDTLTLYLLLSNIIKPGQLIMSSNEYLGLFPEIKK